MSRERDTKKRDCARGMRVFRAQKTRAREPASPRRWRWWQYITHSTNDKSKYDLKKPSEPEEKERGRESFFLYLCVLGKVLSRDTERERNENFGDDDDKRSCEESLTSRRVRCVWAMITPPSEPNIVSLSLSLSLSSLFPRWYRKREEKNKSRCVSEKKFCFVSYLVSFVRDKLFGRWCG